MHDRAAHWAEGKGAQAGRRAHNPREVASLLQDGRSGSRQSDDGRGAERARATNIAIMPGNKESAAQRPVERGVLHILERFGVARNQML